MLIILIVSVDGLVKRKILVLYVKKRGPQLKLLNNDLYVTLSILNFLLETYFYTYHFQTLLQFTKIRSKLEPILLARLSSLRSIKHQKEWHIICKKTGWKNKEKIKADNRLVISLLKHH